MQERKRQVEDALHPFFNHAPAGYRLISRKNFPTSSNIHFREHESRYVGGKYSDRSPVSLMLPQPLKSFQLEQRVCGGNGNASTD